MKYKRVFWELSGNGPDNGWFNGKNGSCSSNKEFRTLKKLTKYFRKYEDRLNKTTIIRYILTGKKISGRGFCRSRITKWIPVEKSNEV